MVTMETTTLAVIDCACVLNLKPPWNKNWTESRRNKITKSFVNGWWQMWEKYKATRKHSSCKPAARMLHKPCGSFTLHGTGIGKRYVLYALHGDRDMEPLFSIDRVPIPCNVHEPLGTKGPFSSWTSLKNCCGWGGGWWGCTVETPSRPMDRMKDRHDWKHYLSATSFARGK